MSKDKIILFGIIIVSLVLILALVIIKGQENKEEREELIAQIAEEEGLSKEEFEESVNKSDLNTLIDNKIFDLIRDIDLDMVQFINDFSSEEVKNLVDADIKYAEENLERLSTPTILFNGELIQIPSTYEQFSESINIAVGASEGPLKIEVFEDYQCPFCAEFFPMTYQAEAEFGDQIEVVHIHLPLEEIHPKARTYALVAEAAEKQDKYLEVSASIFEYEHGKSYDELRDLGLID